MKPEEVTIRVDGRTRLLRSLQWIQVAGPHVKAADWVPPPFGSNTASDAGRGIIIVLDDESLTTGREAPLRSAVRRFLSALTPRDRVALVTMPYGGLRVDFTNEHDKVAQVFGTIAGQASRSETGSDAAFCSAVGGCGWPERGLPAKPACKLSCTSLALPMFGKRLSGRTLTWLKKLAKP